MENFRTKDFLVEACKCCEQLGDYTHSNIVRTVRTSRIFYTINPDLALSKEEIDLRLGSLVQRISKRFPIWGASIHYEYASRLHVHGFFDVECIYAGLEIPLIFIRKEAHQLFGRKKVKHDVCCNVQWFDGFAITYKYVNKQNVYLPQHLRFAYTFNEDMGIYNIL